MKPHPLDRPSTVRLGPCGAGRGSAKAPHPAFGHPLPEGEGMRDTYAKGGLIPTRY